MLTQKTLNQKLHSTIIALSITLGLSLTFLFGVVGLTNVSAADPPPKCDDKKAIEPECVKAGRITLTDDQAKKAGLEERNADAVVAQTLNGVYAIVAIMAVIAIVLAGIRMAIADGDASKVAAARQTVIYAVVGLAVVASAFIITGIVQGVGTK